MCQEDIKEDKDVVKFCKNCFGLEPCLCGNPDYIKTWDFVYWVFKKCKM
jgi:hypothetical protein